MSQALRIVLDYLKVRLSEMNGLWFEFDVAMSQALMQPI